MRNSLQFAVLIALFAAASQARSFDAASVKAIPETVGWPPRAGYWVEPKIEDPQRFRALSQLSSLIEFAWGVRDFQLLGGPAWIRETRVRFEVQAMAAQPSNLAQFRQMLQALLAERFNLKKHRESGEIPVYALVIGKNGPKLQPAEGEYAQNSNGSVDIGKGIFRGIGIPMSTLVRILTENMERPVVDQTNLTGRYDFTLHFDQSSLPDWRLGPALFSLMQDLGLKLEPQKASFEMLVIDSVDRPSEN